MKFFKRSEFKCRCGCGFDTVDYELAQRLDQIRAFFGAPIIINSGCRCVRHNTEIGGVPASQHLLGKAADIQVQGYSPKEVYANLCDRFQGAYGIKEYKTFVHFDVRAEVWRDSMREAV